MALTRRFVALDHTWDEEKAALEAARAEACGRADGLVLKQVQARSYIHSTFEALVVPEGI